VGTHPPATTIQLPGGLALAAAAICLSPSESERKRSQCSSPSQLKPASVACTCASINPGITARPPRSMTRVPRPINTRTSRSEPTATKRPPRIATASWIENRGSTVMILPLRKTKSAGAGAAAERS
jgi:hypothetical protein